MTSIERMLSATSSVSCKYNQVVSNFTYLLNIELHFNVSYQ